MLSTFVGSSIDDGKKGGSVKEKKKKNVILVLRSESILSNLRKSIFTQKKP